MTRSTWLAVCMLGALGIVGHPATAAANPGDASAAVSGHDIEPGYGCADVMLTYSVSLPPEARSWILRIRADSDGSPAAFAQFDGASGDLLSGQGPMNVCAEGEREERNVTWTLDWTYYDQGDLIYASDTGAGATFVVNGGEPPSPFACPECDDTTTLTLRVVRKLDRVWVLKSVLTWRRGSDSARVSDAKVSLVGPPGSGFKPILASTNKRGATTYRVKVPHQPIRLRTYFASGRTSWHNHMIGLPRAYSDRVRVG